MPAKLVVIGDSFVEGRGDPARSGGYRGWVPVFAQLLGIGEDECQNHGEHLATTGVVRDRQLAAVRIARPQLTGMIAGFNDIVGEYRPAEFRDNLRKIFGDLTRHASAAFTATYLDVTVRMAVPPAVRADIRRRTADANAALRETSAEFGMVCLDIIRSGRADEWSDRTLWSDDGIHPNRRGYIRFAHELAATVADSMGIVLASTAAETTQDMSPVQG